MHHYVWTAYCINVNALDGAVCMLGHWHWLVCTIIKATYICGKVEVLDIQLTHFIRHMWDMPA